MGMNWKRQHKRKGEAMSSVAELAKTIGATGYVRVESFHVAVTVIDVRQRFGKVDYLVQPDYPSTGQQWVSEDRLILQGAV